MMMVQLANAVGGPAAFLFVDLLQVFGNWADSQCGFKVEIPLVCWGIVWLY